MNKLLLLFVCFFIGIFLYLLLKNSCKCKVVEGQNINIGDTVSRHSVPGRLFKVNGGPVEGEGGQINYTLEEIDTGLHAGGGGPVIVPAADIIFPALPGGGADILPGPAVRGTVNIIITKAMLDDPEAGGESQCITEALCNDWLQGYMDQNDQSMPLPLRILRLPTVETFPPEYIIWQLSNDSLNSFRLLIYDGEKLMFAEFNLPQTMRFGLRIFTVEWPDAGPLKDIRVGSIISRYSTDTDGIHQTAAIYQNLERERPWLSHIEFNQRWTELPTAEMIHIDAARANLAFAGVHNDMHGRTPICDDLMEQISPLILAILMARVIPRKI